MAIPFNLPTDEQTEDNYRRLDQLLVDLYSVLRQILLRPRCVPLPTRAPDDSSRPAPSNDVTGSRRGDLPDLVSSTLSVPGPCLCPCRRRSQQRRSGQRRRRRCCPGESLVTTPPVVRPLDQDIEEDSWLVAGEQLRKIAEELRATFLKKQEVTEEKKVQEPRPELKVEVKSSGLFSLLVPAHLRSSLWTTVILLVGWRMLARSR